MWHDNATDESACERSMTGDVQHQIVPRRNGEIEVPVVSHVDCQTVEQPMAGLLEATLNRRGRAEQREADQRGDPGVVDQRADPQPDRSRWRGEERRQVTAEHRQALVTGSGPGEHEA